MEGPSDTAAVEIVEVAPGESRFREALEVMRELRTTRSVEELERLFGDASREGGYRLLALFEGGECRAVAGFRVVTSFAHGRHLYVDDLVTGEMWRSHAYGERIELRLRELAREAGCGQIRLDSGVQRKRAHRFYFRRGYAIESFNFGAPLDADG
jgi:hypothetical protein